MQILWSEPSGISQLPLVNLQTLGNVINTLFQSKFMHTQNFQLATGFYRTNSYSSAVITVIILFVHLSVTQWRREGGMCLGWHCAGGAKIRNSEIWPVLANWCLHCRQWVIFFIPLTLPQFWDHTPNCQCSTTHTKQCVTLWLNIHLL